MPQTIYCWRCRMDLPMLTEDEWGRYPSLANAVVQIKAYRELHQCSLAEASTKGFGQRGFDCLRSESRDSRNEPQCLVPSPAQHLWTALPRMWEASPYAPRQGTARCAALERTVEGSSVG